MGAALRRFKRAELVKGSTYGKTIGVKYGFLNILEENDEAQSSDSEDDNGFTIVRQNSLGHTKVVSNDPCNTCISVDPTIKSLNHREGPESHITYAETLPEPYGFSYITDHYHILQEFWRSQYNTSRLGEFSE